MPLNSTGRRDLLMARFETSVGDSLRKLIVKNDVEK